MIIKQDKIIFIHIPKNMGTFIELLLINNLFNVNFKDNTVEFQNYYYSLINYKRNKKYKKYFRNGFKSFHHLPLSYYINRIPKDISEYNIFFISRNPYTRIKSIYNFTNKKLDKNYTFDEFITNEFYKNNPIYPHFSKKQVDFIDIKLENITILKFEEIHKIEEYFTTKLNYKFDNFIVNESKQVDISLEPYLNIINEYYKDDFIYFNYEMIMP